MEQHFVKVDGINIRYLESDPANLINTTSSILEDSATVSADSNNNTSNRSQKKQHHVLFIHGIGTTADRWLDIPDALALSGLHTVAIDLPGFGASDKPEEMNYTIEKFADTIVKFMHEIKIAEDNGIEKTSIVGHSLGGYIAAQVAIENIDLIEKMILIDSSGMLKEPTPILKQYLEVAMNPTKGEVRAIFEKMVANPWRIPDTVVDEFIIRMSSRGAKHAFESALKNSANTQIGLDRLKLIGNYNIPTLIIWGEKDQVIPTEVHYKVFADAIKNSNATIINDAGHAPFSEKPAIVCELLRRFLVRSR